MKKNSFRSLLLAVVSLTIIAVFIYYIYSRRDQYLELLQLSPTGVILLFIISLAFPLLNGMQNTYLYRGLGTSEFSFSDGFLITAASTLANQLPIPGGIVSKGVYLKYKHNLSYTKFTSSTIALFLCYLSVNGFMGIGTLLYWLLIEKKSASPILLICYAGMVACIFVFWLPIERIRVPEKLYQRVSQAIEGWVAISKNPLMLLKIVFLQIILVILLSIRYWLAFHMLSQNVTFGQTMLFASASILTQLVSIAPGGLGVRETIVGAVAATLGFDVGISVVAVGLDRLVVTAMILISGWISMLILGRQIASVSLKDKHFE